MQRLLDRDPRLWFSVSANTRAPRAGEVDGRDYVFLDRDEFERLRDAGGFLEWFDVYGDLKGTPRAPVEEHLAAGDDVLLEVDVQGALAVREAYPEAVLVFVKAPSHEEQRRRLVDRGEDDAEAIERRLARAEAEEALADRFDAVVVNDDPDRATDEVAAILRRYREARPPPEPDSTP
ncbi:MAG: guanylate kinase [Actinomycetota bacterium]|nr:guanylate kinase [Actinomycetota bacterium]